LKNSLESLFTRGISIGSKFLLVGYLAKELSLNEYGSYQLIGYFVLISTTVFGLEFYNLTNRSVVKATDKSSVYKGHLSFFITISPWIIIFQTVLFLLIFPAELISTTNIILVLIIGLCDYFSQEVYRYLMINGSFRKGNIQLIFKSGLFILLLLIYAQIFKELTFSIVLWIMLVSYLLLFLLAYSTFSKTLHVFKWTDFKRLKKQALIKNLRAVLPFVLLVFFLKGIEFSDKFIIGKQLGLEETGVYSFVFQVASSIHIFIISGFYIIYLPQMIQYHASDLKKFKKEIKNFGMITIVSSVFLAVVISVASPYIFALIGKTEFVDHMNLLYLLLIGFVLNNISLIPHLYLYIIEEEKVIMKIMGVSLFLNLGLNFFAIPRFGIVGAGYAFILTYSLVLLLKSISARNKWTKAKY